MQADRHSGKTLPLPQLREALGFSAHYGDAEADRLRQGLRPRQMEDKWLIFFEEGWLYFHRSWTGACIYAVRLDGSPAGVRTIDSWVNRDPDQYKGTDLEYDRKMVGFLIDTLLLGNGSRFPVPLDAKGPAGAYQHHVVGRAYPEKLHSPGGWRHRVITFFFPWKRR